MKPNNKKLFFVKEMPASEEQDVSKLEKVSNGRFKQLLSASQKELLDERYREIKAGYISTKSWEEIKKSIVSQKK